MARSGTRKKKVHLLVIVIVSHMKYPFRCLTNILTSRDFNCFFFWKITIKQRTAGQRVLKKAAQKYAYEKLRKENLNKYALLHSMQQSPS